MNLLSFLLKTFLTKEAITILAKKTGISKDLIRKLLPVVIPVLIKYLTSNASSGEGAQSLLGALTQHTSKRTMAQQIEDADEVDGEKIIHHILGKDNDRVVKELSTRSGVSSAQMIKLLALLAPALLSGLSAASGSAAQAKPANDLSSLMSMFGGAAAAQQQPSPSLGSSLLGSLFGLGGAKPQAAAPAESYSSLSMNGTPATESSLGNLSGLLGALAGANNLQNQVQESALNGSDLLALLAKLAK